MRPDLFEIYRTQPDKFDPLVSREDWQGNLLPAVESIANLVDAVVVELGAGTGRLTRLLAGLRQRWVRTVYRFRDLSEARDLTELEALAVVDEGVILPECTGLWWSTAGPGA